MTAARRLLVAVAAATALSFAATGGARANCEDHNGAIAVADSCDDATLQGCCGDNAVFFCDAAESNMLCMLPCGDPYPPHCGWHSGFGRYWCMPEDTGADPSGTYPIDCADEGCQGEIDCQDKFLLAP